MREPILVLNAGSSSVKFSVFETTDGRALRAGAHGQVDGIDTPLARVEVFDAQGRELARGAAPGTGFGAALVAIHNWFAAHTGGAQGFDGVGHRVVHGGAAYSEPVLIDDTVLARLEELVPLAPLHEPHHIAAIRAARAIAPAARQVACFDTAFHHGQPAVAREYALPRALTAKGVYRYGFHGLSYEYIVGALAALDPVAARGRLVIAHLGNGASMCAVKAGRSMASTMGFTAVDGLPMGTRSGTLDPGVVLYLLQHEGMDAAEVEKTIYERSGLLGVSGISSDMRTLLASGAPAAREAVDLFVYRIGRELGSLVAALGGIDALVFTAGIGEHAPEIRRRVCDAGAWLGIMLDQAANASGAQRISAPGSSASVWAIPTDENLMIARHTRRLLDAA